MSESDDKVDRITGKFYAELAEVRKRNDELLAEADAIHAEWKRDMETAQGEGRTDELVGVSLGSLMRMDQVKAELARNRQRADEIGRQGKAELLQSIQDDIAELSRLVTAGDDDGAV